MGVYHFQFRWIFTLTNLQPQVTLLLKAINYIHCYVDILLNFFSVDIGSVIFVSSETKSQTKEWFVTSIEPRVALTFVKQTYQVVLLSEVDLDVPNVRYHFETQIYKLINRTLYFRLSFLNMNLTNLSFLQITAIMIILYHMQIY